MIWSNIFQHIPKMFHHLNGNYWNYIVLGLYLLLFVGILKSGIFHKLWNICIGFNIFMGIYLLDSCIGNIPMYWFQYIYILGIYLLESWNWFQYIYGIYLLDPEYSINSNVPPCIGSFFFSIRWSKNDWYRSHRGHCQHGRSGRVGRCEL